MLKKIALLIQSLAITPRKFLPIGFACIFLFAGVTQASVDNDVCEVASNDSWLCGWWQSCPPKQIDRPSCRPKVTCWGWWPPFCPSGYSWRDVTSAAEVECWHIGKCVDRTSYRGESCGYGARPADQCQTGNCEEPTAEEIEELGHDNVCK